MGLLDIIKNPATGKVSHSKLWTNIACAAATYKFVIAPDAPSEIWAIYLGIIGGYGVARSYVSVKRQEVEQSAEAEIKE